MKRRIVFPSHRHEFRVAVVHADERMTAKYFHPSVEATREQAQVQERLLG